MDLTINIDPNLVALCIFAIIVIAALCFMRGAR